jgi:hypothetical protein
LARGAILASRTGGGTGSRRPPARQLASGNLQLQGSWQLRADFISQNVKDLLGYEPAEYLEHADFWRSRVHPQDLARIEKDFVQLFEEGHLIVCNTAYGELLYPGLGTPTPGTP